LRGAAGPAMMGRGGPPAGEEEPMSRVTKPPVLDDLDYPTTDGKPMAETDWHRKLMTHLIETLTAFFLPSPRVYVSGNLLVFYEPGNRRRHVSPDVFVVRGVPKHDRPNYLIWRERKAPEFVIELTSSSTRHEDVARKFALYRDTLRVKEYFLFDPFEDYLDPPMQGYRLHKGVYVPIRPVHGRFPSRVVRLHLERAGSDLRLWDPATDRRLLTPEEARHQAEERAELAEAEVKRLRREIEQLRHRNGR
jgi:Uma2 family endonuclease